MKDLITQRKNYKAKYNINFFERKNIHSYALWAIYVKGENHQYPKLPTAYGRTDTLEQANIALTDWCIANNITIEMMRCEGLIPWRLIKDLLEGKSGSEYFARAILKPKGLLGLVKDSDLVFEGNKNKILTSSLLVAEKFNKPHKNVLRAIDNIPKDDFWRLNYEPREYLDERGKMQPMVDMTWKGFSMLAMGFTGEKVYIWKKSFLDAFESMGEEIYRRKEQLHNPLWIETRENGKIQGRLTLTDRIQLLEELADQQGGPKLNKDGVNIGRKYYSTITKMIYKELFGDSSLKNVRDQLDILKLTFLSICEQSCSDEIEKLVTIGMDYHDIYQECKKRVIATVQGLSASKLTTPGTVVKLAWDNG
jgi:Rha family phage regulatory protein